MKYGFTAMLMVCFLSAVAQSEKRKLLYTTAVNVSPFALVDVDHGAMIGGEYRFAPNLSVLMDAAYIFYSNYYSEAEKSTGFNVRPAFRYYFGKRQHEFLQLQAFYKHVNYSMSGWLGKDCVNNVPSYHQLQNFGYKKNVMGVNFMIGDILPLSDKLYVDIGLGLGVRFKTHKISEPHACIPRQTNNLISRYDEKVTAISLPFAVKFAYILD